MKKIIASIAIVALVGISPAANTTNLFPNGNFESGGAGDWVEGGCDLFSYPATDGNPGGYGVIDDTAPCWGIWVGGDSIPLSLSSLGLVAGQTYTFVQDMKIISGASIGGIKIESWTTNALGAWVHLSNSGDLRPSVAGHNTANWETYSFTYTISAAARGLKIVPLWGPSSVVGYDNLGVVVPVTGTPLSVSITSPTNTQVVYSNFLINATATVFPATVTNVGFYLDGVLLGNDAISPFSYTAVGVSAGAHALRTIARDSNGNSATSSVVNVTVTSTPEPPFSAYEPFNYPLGAFADGTASSATGFTGAWAVPSGNASMVANQTYVGLATANNALQQANNGTSRSLANFSRTLSSGTKYVSFLVRNSFDSGGNWAGVYLKGDNATSLFAGFRGGFSVSQTSFGLGSVNSGSTAPTAGTSLGRTVPLDNTTAHLIVVKIIFNTSGANDTVSFWANPPAGASDPGVAANATITTFDVGNLSGIGLNLQGGSPTFTLDEIRVGETYADVVGGNLNPTIPTTLDLAIVANKKVSWTANNTHYYQPQKSSDNSSWSDLGGLLFGSATASVFDNTPAAFYQVLEIAPVTSDVNMDGGFEISDGLSGAFYWTSLGSQPPTRITSDFHTGEACMSLFVTNVDLNAKTTTLQQNLTFATGNQVIVGGQSYGFSFWAKSLGRNSGGGYVQQYRIAWLNDVGGVVGTVGWTTFAGGTNAWLQISTGPVAAPTNAVNALLEVFAATGGILGDFGGVLIDDMALSGSTPSGATTVLTPTVQEAATFVATIKNNGLTVTAASGTVQFKTNNVGLGVKFVADGIASSDAVAVPASYVVTATYSGDATYIGSMATLTVGSGINPTPTNITVNVSGNQLTLSWPASHLGWMLQAQTNSLSAGLQANWVDVAGSSSSTQVVMTINPANPAVFYRLRTP